MPTLIALLATTPLLEGEQEELRLETIMLFGIRRTEAEDPSGLLPRDAGDPMTLLCSLVGKVTKPPVSDGFAGVLVSTGTDPSGLCGDLAKPYFWSWVGLGWV